MLEITDAGPVKRVLLHHGKANALDLELAETLSAALRHAQATRRAVVLGAHGRIFSAGVDLKRFLEESDEYRTRFLAALCDLFRVVLEAEVPVVAAINGHALAGGCVLALGADRRFGTEGPATLGLPELLVGVPFPTAALEIVRRGAPDVGQDLAFSGRSLEFPQAQRLGLLHRLTDPDRLLEEATEEAARLGALGETFRLVKRQWSRPYRERLERDGADHDAAVARVWSDPDTIARVRRYVDATLRR